MVCIVVGKCERIYCLYLLISEGGGCEIKGFFVVIILRVNVRWLKIFWEDVCIFWKNNFINGLVFIYLYELNCIVGFIMIIFLLCYFYNDLVWSICMY